MRRREIIAALGVAAWPLAARAQQPTLPVIGFLHSASPAGYAEFVTAFQEGLAEVGFVEGRNVATEYRWADGAYDRLPALAAELARLQPTVIFANTLGRSTSKRRQPLFRSCSQQASTRLNSGL